MMENPAHLDPREPPIVPPSLTESLSRSSSATPATTDGSTGAIDAGSEAAKPSGAFQPKSSYSRDELIQCGNGELFGPGNARLPLPNMLMFDRITHISGSGGAHGLGEVVAEMDVRKDAWFFACHFATDPVMPGCLGLDALWQMVGFYLGWRGNPGRGRALGAGGIKFSGQVLPDCRTVRYDVQIKKRVERRLVVAVADGTVSVDGREIYTATDLKVGLFTQIDF